MNIGRWMAVLVMGLMAAGCDTEVYRTQEGVGVTGPTGGYFQCYDEFNCSGTPG